VPGRPRPRTCLLRSVFVLPQSSCSGEILVTPPPLLSPCVLRRWAPRFGPVRETSRNSPETSQPPAPPYVKFFPCSSPLSHRACLLTSKGLVQCRPGRRHYHIFSDFSSSTVFPIALLFLDEAAGHLAELFLVPLFERNPLPPDPGRNSWYRLMLLW